MNECLCQDWFSTRGNPCWGHTLIQEGTPFLPANRHVSASYIRVHNPARCYLRCLHAWYQGGLATPHPLLQNLRKEWSATEPRRQRASPQIDRRCQKVTASVEACGWMAPATPQRKRTEAIGKRSTWLSALVGGYWRVVGSRKKVANHLATQRECQASVWFLWYGLEILHAGSSRIFFSLIFQYCEVLIQSFNNNC